jgi:hypothetical protein
LKDAWFLKFIDGSTDDELKVTLIFEMLRKKVIEKMPKGSSADDIALLEPSMERICLTAAEGILVKSKGVTSQEQFQKVLEDEAKELAKRYPPI